MYGCRELPTMGVRFFLTNAGIARVSMNAASLLRVISCRPEENETATYT